jgi:DNA-binding NarL/FixJ family response regulator
MCVYRGLGGELAGQDANGTAPGPSEAPVLVVDPDSDQRREVAEMLTRAGFRVKVIESGEEALEEARRERPNLVVLEVRLSDISGYEVCRSLKDEFGDSVGVIFVSRDRTETSDRVAGLMIGADDYMCKPLAADELVARARGLARRTEAHEHLGAPALRAGLTPRELEVLQLLADGHNQEAIAERLFVSPRTVGKHIEHILSKLPARSRAEAVAIAYQRGLHAPTEAGRATV